MRKAIGVIVGICGTVGGLAMVIHGFSTGSYYGEWGVVEGAMLIAMSLVVFTLTCPKR